MNTHNSWFSSKGYLQGAFWMILMCVFSNLNDVLIKYLGMRLPGVEITFFRFFFSSIVLLPFILFYGKKVIVTHYPNIQFIRALLLVVAISFWCYGVISLPLTTTTTIGFTTPFFVLPLAKIFLKEHVGWQRGCATFFGFIGIVIILHPSGFGFNIMVLSLVISTIIFSVLDIINKKLLIKDENILSMIFYSALGATILAFIPAVMAWKTPIFQELLFLFLLGGGANLILFCLLKAYFATDVTAIQPFRYFELILSSIFGLIIFNELPNINNIFGSSIIVAATFYIAIYEMRYQYKKTAESKFELKDATY